MRGWGAVTGSTPRQSLLESLASACVSCGARGNSDAVWPSSPMPSSTTSNGRGIASSACAQAASPCAGVAAEFFSGTKFAFAASFRSRCLRIRPALLSGSSSPTHRSSASVTQTRCQSKACRLNETRTGPGLRPPDTTRLALPRRRVQVVCDAARQFVGERVLRIEAVLEWHSWPSVRSPRAIPPRRAPPGRSKLRAPRCLRYRVSGFRR